MTTVMDEPTRTKRPRMKELTRRQSEFVLARNSVARIAFEHNGRVELMPVHYVFKDGAIIGRTSLGKKYLNWLVAKEVVVEVDEVFGQFDWRSVVVRGAVSLMRVHGGTDREREEFSEAVAALRTLIPNAFRENDPTPDRRFIFRVQAAEVTGREATTKP